MEIKDTEKIDSLSLKSSSMESSLSSSSSSSNPSTNGKSLASSDISVGILGNSSSAPIFSRTSSVFFPDQGRLPVNISSTIQPSAQISQGASCTISITASGDKYIGVPLQYGSNLLFLLSTSALFANPKSPIFA
ncbi:hypothetical protein ACJIZ3_005029 [Penstemon smallii]|uniref:REJ domain-containing protein n=1 Tax=Penstemon smallii TaxID=265156 RepID=A0ABD3S3R0_9LAMI